MGPMLDTFTLRVVFVVLALCALLLFLPATLPPVRSRYAAWWCLALLGFGAGSALFMLNGTAAQVVANPMGNVVGVAGAVCMWAGARSLAPRRLPPAVWIVALGVTALAAFLDDPADDIWTGGGVYLAAMAVSVGGASYELFRVLVTTPASGAGGDSQYRVSLAAMAVGCGIFALFYAARALAFVILGRDSFLFETVLGSEVTTLLIIVTLAIAIFSLSALSRAQYTAELRRQATHDGLTGLLNRNEFLRQAGAAIGRLSADTPAVVVLADVDRFKELNDRHGHSAGDRALAAVGSICRRQLRPGELAGRLGGDEFALLLTDVERARGVADLMNDEVAAIMGDGQQATISFGLSWAERGQHIDQALERADRALYEAKARGGRRISVDGSSS